ncbi:MAG TPA: H-X9-DG-CTERM domain-containing protein [Tepidisphaeraceae bacterium]
MHPILPVRATVKPRLGAPNQLFRYVMSRHGNAVNVVFMDGHGATVPVAELWDLRWSKKVFRRPAALPSLPP